MHFVGGMLGLCPCGQFRIASPTGKRTAPLPGGGGDIGSSTVIDKKNNAVLPTDRISTQFAEKIQVTVMI